MNPDHRPFPRRMLIGANRLLVRGLAGGRVRSGPFTGMHYTGGSGGSVYAAKVLGTYEQETSAQVRALQDLGLAHLIDVGAAEGYFAVGCARTLGCAVTAFETSEVSRQLLDDMARRNGVRDRIDIRAACDPDRLAEAIRRGGRGRVAIICDVEGYEGTLLDPDRVPELPECWLLVETHDCFNAGVTRTLEQRFSRSHRITRIPSRPRSDEDYPGGSALLGLVPRRLRHRWMDERRPTVMTWLWMEPLSASPDVGASRHG